MFVMELWRLLGVWVGFDFEVCVGGVVEGDDFVMYGGLVVDGVFGLGDV